MYVRENLQYFQNIKKNLKLGNFTTSFWSLGKNWNIYINIHSVWGPSELCEVAQLQKFFSLNLLKSICIQSSIMVKSWIIHKNQFWALFLMKYCIFAKNGKNEQKNVTFWQIELAQWIFVVSRDWKCMLDTITYIFRKLKKFWSWATSFWYFCLYV